MAAARNKKSPRKAPAKRRSTKSKGGNPVAANAGYLANGIRLILEWCGGVVLALVTGVRWIALRAYEAVVGERGRQPIGMILAAASVFAMVALLDYQRGQPNLCGRLGYDLAELMMVLLGLGAFLPPAFGAFWGVARLIREESSGHALTKLVGILVLAFTASLAAQGLGDIAPTNTFPRGQGGWLGATVFSPLAESLGPFGLTVLISLMAGLALLMATEWAFVPLVRQILAKGREAVRQPELPWGKGERKPLREEAAEDRERAARAGRGFWHGMRGLFASFHPDDDASATATAEGGPTTVSEVAAADLRVSVGGRDLDEVERESREGADLTPAIVAAPVAAMPTQASAPAVIKDLPSGELVELPGISEAPEMRDHAIDADAPTKPATRKRPTKQPRLDSLPTVDLLQIGHTPEVAGQREEINRLGQQLQGAFDAFGLSCKVIGAERGPTLTMFEVQLASGVSVNKLKNLVADIGVALGTHSVRVVHPLVGRSTVGVEVPNLKRDSVFLRDVFEDADLSIEKNTLPMVLGRDVFGKEAVEDLTKMPHMLIAGTTGSGKSVCINSILATMLLTRTPDQVRMVMIDPKQVELQVFSDIPHLLCPVVTDMKRASFVLEWSLRQMEDRLHAFKMTGVRNIADYNALGEAGMEERFGEEWDAEDYPLNFPYMVIVIDELADLMMTNRKEVESAIARLAAKARAAGIHLIVATQRPSADVVTGLIKANLPVRMAFKVNTGIDSRVILDDGGAEALLGNGDFLYRPPGSAGLTRGQGCFVSTAEVNAICDHLRVNGKPEFLEDLIQGGTATSGVGHVDDDLWEDAVLYVLQSGRGSASLLQRRFSIGYTRASRLIDIMGDRGLIGPHVGSKAREVLVTVEDWQQQSSATT